MNTSAKVEDHVLLGLHFDAEMVAAARRDDRMLVLDMDLTRECNLKCFYCDRTPDRFDEERRELTFEERKDLIRQARDLGVQTVCIVGAGEPMLDPDFWPLLEYMQSLGMIPLVYTSGWEIHDTETIDRLYRLGASIMLKYNTEDEATADKMVGVKGYGKHVKQVLQWFLDRGFNQTAPPRLGINVVATLVAQEEEAFLELFRWCRRNNVYMHGQSLIPQGRAHSEKMVLHRQEALRLLERAAQFDAEECGIHYEIVPPIVGGYRCRKLNIGLFVNAFGEVWDCNGSARRVSDFRKESLADIWHSTKARKIRAPLQEGFCFLRERWWHKAESGDATEGEE